MGKETEKQKVSLTVVGKFGLWQCWPIKSRTKMSCCQVVHCLARTIGCDMTNPRIPGRKRHAVESLWGCESHRRSAMWSPPLKERQSFYKLGTYSNARVTVLWDRLSLWREFIAHLRRDECWRTGRDEDNTSCSLSWHSSLSCYSTNMCVSLFVSLTLRDDYQSVHHSDFFPSWYRIAFEVFQKSSFKFLNCWIITLLRPELARPARIAVWYLCRNSSSFAEHNSKQLRAPFGFHLVAAYFAEDSGTFLNFLLEYHCVPFWLFISESTAKLRCQLPFTVNYRRSLRLAWSPYLWTSSC